MSEKKSSWAGMQDMSNKARASEEPQAPIKVEFQKLSASEPIKYLKVAVHGQQKVGKTRFALSAPAPVYVLATEPGLRPLMKLYPDKDIYFTDVYEPDYSGTFEVEPTMTLAKIDAAVREIRRIAKENPASVGTVVLDSVTDIWKWVQEWMKVEILKIDKTARVKQQWDWGYATNKYQNIIMQVLSLPCHVILTAQDKEEYSGPGSPTGLYEPRWQNQTPYWVDIVIGMQKLSDPKLGLVRYSSTIEDSRHMDASLKPIANISKDNLTFDMLVALLKGELK